MLFRSYWIKLLKLRQVANPLLIHRIGNGEHTSLWYDNWLPTGPLLDKFPERIVYDAALTINAKVCTIIRGLEWDWPTSHTIYLDEVRTILSTFCKPTGIRDTVRWKVTPIGTFNSSIIWDHLRVHNPVVSWNKIVWFPGGNPRHSFVLWLAVHTRLSTHDRIYKFTHGPLACVFCHSQMESHDHLFFACPYSLFIWQDLMLRCGLRWNGHTWKDTLH